MIDYGFVALRVSYTHGVKVKFMRRYRLFLDRSNETVGDILTVTSRQTVATVTKTNPKPT